MVVFVHGLSASSRWWSGVLPLLGEREARVLDLPRFGRGFPPAATLDWLARELEDAAPVDLVGHSLGGLVSARLAAGRPDLVRRLVLCAPVGAPAARSLVHHGMALARTAATAPLPLLRAMATDALRWGPEALVRGSFFVTGQSFAGAIVAPTLLIWGARDRLVPLELATAWQKLLPGTRLAVIPGAGHAPMIEMPSAFVELLLEFLDEPGDEGGVGPVRGVTGVRHDDQAAARDA